MAEQRLKIFALSQNGALLGAKIRAVAGGELVGLEGRVSECDRLVPSIANALREAFKSGEAIVAIMASGALIRILAPLLEDKQNEPPVIAIAEDGASIVPLLGGHRGANEIARRIASALGGHA